MNPPPTVSFVVPVYNAASYLSEALESVLMQTFANFELIAVDDGSTDCSLTILRQIAKRDPRLRIVSRPNTGIVGALNDGLAAAKGEFIARMDADDLSLPTRLERQLAYLQAHPACIALGSAVLFTDPRGRPLKVYSPPLSHAEIESELAGGNGGALIHPTVVFRREPLLRCGAYRQRYNFIEDLDLYVRLLEVGELANLPEVLLHYRQHPRSVNHAKGSRAAQAAEIIAPLRAKRGMPPTTAGELSKDAPKVGTVADCHRKWALDAAEGKNYRAALANALRAVGHNPLARINWSTLRYILGLKRANPTSNPRV